MIRVYARVMTGLLAFFVGSDPASLASRSARTVIRAEDVVPQSRPARRQGDTRKSAAQASGTLDGVLVKPTAPHATAPVTPPEEASIAGTVLAGRWLLADAGGKSVYLFQDGGRAVDPFSYHTRDANGDGIDEVRLGDDGRFLIIESQGLPSHPTATFPNASNPNPILPQHFTFRLPLEPRVTSEITRLPMGPIAVALNGVVFFNPFERGGMNAVEGYSEEWLDSCCGHPQATGIYHYHKYPTCVKSPFVDDGKGHSPIIGFAFDGFPIHGPWEAGGLQAMDVTGPSALDVCNGHSDPDRGYHYHVTPGRFPYVIGGYRGTPETSNSRGLRRAGVGPIEDNAEGRSRLEAVIADVRPGTVSRGGRRDVSLVLDPQATRHGPLPTVAPQSVHFGPYAAETIVRDGESIVVTLDIPADANVGVLLDCHIVFDGDRSPRVFKRNEALRVAD